MMINGMSCQFNKFELGFLNVRHHTNYAVKCRPAARAAMEYRSCPGRKGWEAFLLDANPGNGHDANAVLKTISVYRN